MSVIPKVMLRRAGPDDADMLALIGSATFLTAFAHDHPGDALLSHCTHQHSRALYEGWLANHDYAFWLAETELGAPVGYVMLSPPDLDLEIPGGGLELKRIYTLAGWQGQKLGDRMMTAVIAEATARGADRLYLCVYEINHAAQRFYARYDFHKVGEQQFYVGDIAFTDWILVREL